MGAMLQVKHRGGDGGSVGWAWMKTNKKLKRPEEIPISSSSLDMFAGWMLTFATESQLKE